MSHQAEDGDRGSEQGSKNSDTSGADEPVFGRDPDKPMSQEQQIYLHALAESQGAELRDNMSEADAAVTIDRLQENAVHLY
jgi:hypothetical protein